MLLVFGAGASVGPFAAGLVMSAIGPWALFGWIAIVFAALTAFSGSRLRVSITVAPEAQSHFVPAIATTQEALELTEAQVWQDSNPH